MPRSGATRPVEIIYYPKRGRRTATVETLITDSGEAPRKAGKQRRRTLTDETPDPALGALLELSRLGHGLFEAGRLDEARVIFESLVRLGPPDPFPHTMLGTIALAQHHHDQALEHFDAALVIDPLDVTSLVYRGEVRLARKKVSRAVEDLERAVACGVKGDPFVVRAERLLALARGKRSPPSGLR